jgi:hypothetical protein
LSLRLMLARLLLRILHLHTHAHIHIHIHKCPAVTLQSKVLVRLSGDFVGMCQLLRHFSVGLTSGHDPSFPLSTRDKTLLSSSCQLVQEQMPKQLLVSKARLAVIASLTAVEETLFDSPGNWLR